MISLALARFYNVKKRMDLAFRPVSIGPQSEPQWNCPSLNTILLSHPREQQQLESQFFTFSCLPAYPPLFHTAWLRAQIFHVLSNELVQKRHHNAVDDAEERCLSSKLQRTLMRRRSLRVDPPPPPLFCTATVVILKCWAWLLLSRGLLSLVLCSWEVTGRYLGCS